MKCFYTYLWFRENGTPYYVGKGSDTSYRRAYERRQFKRKHNVYCPESRKRVLIEHWESEERAFEIERYYIRLFGRKDNGTGILRNLTDGGEGCSGAKRSQHTRQLMRISKIGVSSGWLKGHSVSQETRDKIKAALSGRDCGAQGRKRCAELKTGIFKPGIAAKAGRVTSHKRWHVARNIISADCSLCSPKE